MKWEPSVSWGGELGNGGIGSDEGDRLFTAMKHINMINTHTQTHMTRQTKTKKQAASADNDLQATFNNNNQCNDSNLAELWGN